MVKYLGGIVAISRGGGSAKAKETSIIEIRWKYVSNMWIYKEKR